MGLRVGSREAGVTEALELGPGRGAGCRMRTLCGFCRNRHGAEGEPEARAGRGATRRGSARQVSARACRRPAAPAPWAVGAT